MNRMRNARVDSLGSFALVVVPQHTDEGAGDRKRATKYPVGKHCHLPCGSYRLPDESNVRRLRWPKHGQCSYVAQPSTPIRQLGLPPAIAKVSVSCEYEHDRFLPANVDLHLSWGDGDSRLGPELRASQRGGAAGCRAVVGLVRRIHRHAANDPTHDHSTESSDACPPADGADGVDEVVWLSAPPGRSRALPRFLACRVRGTKCPAGGHSLGTRTVAQMW